MGVFIPSNTLGTSTQLQKVPNPTKKALRSSLVKMTRNESFIGGYHGFEFEFNYRFLFLTLNNNW